MTKFKSIIFISLFVAFFLLISKPAHALAKFETSYQITYRLNENGKTHVGYIINQKNNLSVVYATDFGISINGTKMENIKVKDQGTPVQADVIKTTNQTSISFPFINKIVGKDKNHTFTLEYDTDDIASKFGNTWQIDIPRLEQDENIVEQTVVLVVPEGFPAPAYIDPKPDVVNGNTYYFSGKKISHKPISAIFGQTQYYEGNIVYHLGNSQLQKVKTGIAIPPDTSYQTIYIKKLHPKPVEIKKDIDGNILAYYELGAGEKIDIDLDIIFKLEFTPKPSIIEPSETSLSKNHIWNFDNSAFSGIGISSLNTPKAIYDYVVDKMIYDYEKINRQRPIRTPAAESLINFQSAICTDFTDVFVALARKSNIYARELQGFAISDNPDLKPLSLDRDILHAWPEYFDKSKNTWIQIDPTWANTTRGIDYFNKLDFNHIVLAIHGENPEYPVPAGGYKNDSSLSRDINIEPTFDVDIPVPNVSLSFQKQEGDDLLFEVKNDLGVSFIGNVNSNEDDHLQDSKLAVDIPPYSTQIIKIGIKNKPFIRKFESEVIIDIDGKPYRQPYTLGSTSSQTILFTGIGGFLAIGAITARGVYLRKRKQAPNIHW